MAYLSAGSAAFVSDVSDVVVVLGDREGAGVLREEIMEVYDVEVREGDGVVVEKGKGG